MDILNIIYSLSGLVAGVHIVANIIITQLVKKGVTLSSLATQIISWLISVALGFVWNYYSVGIFAGLSVVNTLIYGLLLGLLSNGIFDLTFIESILNAIGLKKKSA